jgi:glycosyltransferase involved in cell wall biosynthesis
MEADLVRRVDGIVVVSQFLAKRMAGAGKPVRIITQGVDAGHFRPAGATIAPARFEIVYFGMIDDRVDQDLLVKAARALPSTVFRLIGPETLPTDRLKALPNIILEGPVDYAQLPLAVLTAGAFVLPFQMSDLSKSCSPVKLKEYLACGRPVITTAMPEALLMKDHLHIARDHDEFIALLASASQGALPVSSEAVGRFLDSESWQGKAEAFAAFIQELRPR